MGGTLIFVGNGFGHTVANDFQSYNPVLGSDILPSLYKISSIRYCDWSKRKILTSQEKDEGFIESLRTYCTHFPAKADVISHIRQISITFSTVLACSILAPFSAGKHGH